MSAAWSWSWTILTSVLIGLILPTAIIAERFTPAITPTHLPLVNGIGSNAMLLTRTSMPPGLTAASPAYTAPTADQLADDHAAWAWIGPTARPGSVPLAFIVSRVAEIAVANQAWPQVSHAFFALRMFNGSVQIYEATGAQDANGVAEFSAPYWLNGVYSEMTAGESHICFLSTDRHVECKTTVNPFPAPSALMTHRSAETYTQITAASRFTCGLRALDQPVECFGALDRDSALIPVNYTSTLRYASIAAQFDSGFCGVVVDTGNLACYSVHATGPAEAVALPAPTAPVSFLYPLWLFLDGSAQLPWSQACAMRNDGMIDCVLPLQVGVSSQRPMSQATSVNLNVMGATSDSGQLQQSDSTTDWTSSLTVNLFEPRFIAVDPAQGNDTACTAVRTQDLNDMLNFVPCVSLTQALTLVAHPQTWVQLLPGTYPADSLSLNYSETTIASSSPSYFTPNELALFGDGSWAARLTETAGQTVTIDCFGSLHCFSTIHLNVQFVGLTFTGSLQHAIVSVSDQSGSSARLPDSTLTITNCIFNATGLAVFKARGTLTISGCTISNSRYLKSRELDPIFGMIELEDASLTMSGTTFAHNHLPSTSFGPDTFGPLRSCLRSVSSLPVTLSITDSSWRNNSAPSDASGSIPGGVAMQVQANGPLALTVSDSTFALNRAVCCGCMGGAVSVNVGGAAASDAIKATFKGVTFDSNQIVPPWCFSSPSTSGGDLSISVYDGSGTSQSPLTAVDATLSNCTFSNSQAIYGGCLALGTLTSLLLTDSSFSNCTAVTGGSVYVGISSIAAGVVQSDYVLSGLMLTSSLALLPDGSSSEAALGGGVGGGIALVSILTSVTIESSNFSDSMATLQGGGIYVSGCKTVFIDSCNFLNLSGTDAGGAVAVTDSPSFRIFGTLFRDCTARSRGGAIVATNSGVDLNDCVLEDVGLQYLFNQSADPTTATDRVGGAVAVVGGQISLSGGSYTRISALPNDLQLSSCVQYYDASAGLSSIGLGGVLSAELSQVTVSEVSVANVSACSGGLLYARASHVQVKEGSYSMLAAYSGGLFAVTSYSSVSIKALSTSSITAVMAGGAAVFSESPQIEWLDNVELRGISVKQGDGGLLWIHAIWRPRLNFQRNTLSGVTTPNGAGAVIFVHSATNAFAPLDPVDDPALGNQFNQTSASSLYGPLIATGVWTLISTFSHLVVPAGSPLSTDSHPLLLFAVDAYQQRITQDRGLVVQVAGPAAVEFRGTPVRKTQSSDGSAPFTDLRVSAAPGHYMLTFSIVTAPQITVALNLTVTGDCPSASFYSSSDRSCIACGSDVLVYNATENACQRCPAGWQRVASNDTSGALRDGVSCAICPLGQVSSAGGLCAPCGPNTYQPTPLSECVQCSTVDGLSCVGDGLAQVQSGFFALAVGSGTQQRIQTYQCPETFCSAAEVQVATATGNSSALASASAVNSFSQCAYPRLASPTNLLCGECAVGYHPWGNKCAQCDSVDGGLLFGMIVGSLALIGFLIRSSFGSPSAGHSVVVLYFAQTAMLELGSLNSLLSWLNIVLLSLNSVGKCVAPLSAYEQVQAQILMPVVLELELLCIGALHWFAFHRRGGAVAAARELASPPLPALAPLSSKLRSSVASFVSLFSIDLYVAASLSLLLFCYTQVAVACMSYLHCVDVGSESVVFSQPSMRCSSAEYARTWVLVVIALVGFVVGFPLAIGWFLWFRMDRVHGAQIIIADRARGENAKRNGDALPTISPAVAPHPADASPAAAGAAAAAAPVSPVSAPAAIASSSDADSDSEESDLPAEWGVVRRRAIIASDGTIVTDTSSVAAITAEAMANERFLRRFAPVFAMYRPSAWFWHAFMLCRRTVFVALSIGLVSTPRARFLAFGFAHVLSLLLQLISSPFRLEFFNRAEFASHLLLITLSMTLTAYLAPYPFGIDLFLFLLIILSLLAYALIASNQHVGERRARKAMLEYAQRQGKREEQAQAAQQLDRAGGDGAVTQCSLVGVEMGELHSNRADATTASDPQWQANPATDVGLLGSSGAAHSSSDSAQL